MNHRVVSTVVVIIVSLFVVAAGLFAWAATAVTPSQYHATASPDNPHPPMRQTDRCLTCHTVARATLPVTHRYYDVGSCASCHHPAVPVLVPHSVAMGDARCPLCHGDPSRDLGVPTSHLRYETDECLLCHPVDADHYAKKPAPAGLSLSPAASIPHATDGIFEDCTYCHQFGPKHPLPRSHKDFALEVCQDCHKAGVSADEE